MGDRTIKSAFHIFTSRIEIDELLVRLVDVCRYSNVLHCKLSSLASL